jgi:hypothetical protein
VRQLADILASTTLIYMNIILWVGTKDVSNRASLEQFERDYLNLIEVVRSRCTFHCKVVVCLLLPRFEAQRELNAQLN